MPKGGFWTANEALCYEPKRQFRFLVDIDGMALEDNESGDAYHDAPDTSLMWYIKSVDKPSVALATVEDGEIPWGDGVPQPLTGGPLWKPVTMTMVDPQYPNATRKLMRLIRRAGYLDEKAQGINNNSGDFQFAYLKGAVGKVEIHQLDALGERLETWQLIDAWPGEINFGKLDYSSDDFVEISVTWVYSYAKLIAYGAEGDKPLDSDSGLAMQGDHYDGQMNERSFTYQRNGPQASGKIGTGTGTVKSSDGTSTPPPPAGGAGGA